MSKTKIGINGFGRIGRSAFKIAFERSDCRTAGFGLRNRGRRHASLL